MTKREKRLVKLKNNPTTASLREMKTILSGYGYKIVRIKGSHYFFEHETQGIISIPVHNQKVKQCYIKRLIQIIASYEKL